MTSRRVWGSAVALLLIATLVVLFYFFVGMPLAQWFRERLGGGTTIPSFLSDHQMGVGVVLLILCAVLIGLWIRKNAASEKKEVEKSTSEVKGKDTKEKKGPKEGSFISMDNSLIVSIVVIGAGWSIWWIFTSSNWENKEVVGSIVGVIFLHEAWQIFAHGKDPLKGYQWIIRFGCFILGLWFPLSYLLSHVSLSIGIR